MNSVPQYALFQRTLPRGLQVTSGCDSAKLAACRPSPPSVRVFTHCSRVKPSTVTFAFATVAPLGGAAGETVTLTFPGARSITSYVRRQPLSTCLSLVVCVASPSTCACPRRRLALLVHTIARSETDRHETHPSMHSPSSSGHAHPGCPMRLIPSDYF